MDEKKLRYLYNVFFSGPFSPGLIMDTGNVIRFMIGHDITTEEYLEFVDVLKARYQESPSQERKRLLRANVQYDPITFVCPSCGSDMQLFPGDDNDSHWVCGKCRFGIYNSESFDVLMKKMLGIKKFPKKRKKTVTRGSKRRRR